MEEQSLPNYSLLEETLSYKIRDLYIKQLGHAPQQVVCNLSDNSLTIVIEHPITPPERILIENHKNKLAEEVSWNLYKALEPQLKVLIEGVVRVSVVDLLGTSSIDSDRTSIIAVLAARP